MIVQNNYIVSMKIHVLLKGGRERGRDRGKNRGKRREGGTEEGWKGWREPKRQSDKKMEGGRESRAGMRTEKRLLRQTGNERGQEEKSKNESEIGRRKGHPD